MSSSFHLKQRKESGKFVYPKTSFYGDTYVRAVGECHPDFIAQPFGPLAKTHPRDAQKMCIRKNPFEKDDSMTVKLDPRFPSQNVYYKTKELDYYQNSVFRASKSSGIPDESFLLEKDYLRWEVPYNGLGIQNSIKNSRTIGNKFYST